MPGLLLQVTELERVAKEWGWPTLVLVAICWVIYIIVKKALWPFLSRYLDRAEKQQDLAQNILERRATKLEEAQDTILKGFQNSISDLAEALTNNNELQKTQVNALQELLERDQPNDRESRRHR